MSASRSSASDDPIGLAGGRLRWSRDGSDLVAGAYRIRLTGPRQWEVEFRGRPIGAYDRRSMAFSEAEHHRRETERVYHITFWAFMAGCAFTTVLVAAAHLTSPAGFFTMAAAVAVLLGSTARCIAAVSRNLLDPYRAREEWEPADWWNHGG